MVNENVSAHKTTEAYLENAYFIHGSNFSGDVKDELNVMQANLGDSHLSTFIGLRLDTCANTSVISETQYNSYCSEFARRPSIISDGTRQFTGIGGIRKPIGFVKIQIPFSGLDLVIDVYFLVLKEKAPTLLSMPDIIMNGLDFSVQGQHVSHGKLCHKLTCENNFLVHRWTEGDVSFSCYTEN